MDEIKEMRNQIRTLRWCNLITQITFLIVTIILQVQYFRIRSYYQETIRQNAEIISVLESQTKVLESQNSELRQTLAILEFQNDDLQQTLLILEGILPD